MSAILTVGLIAGDRWERAERSLAHLLRQTALNKIEVIVLDISQDGRGK